MRKKSFLIPCFQGDYLSNIPSVIKEGSIYSDLQYSLYRWGSRKAISFSRFCAESLVSFNAFHEIGFRISCNFPDVLYQLPDRTAKNWSDESKWKLREYENPAGIYYFSCTTESAPYYFLIYFWDRISFCNIRANSADFLQELQKRKKSLLHSSFMEHEQNVQITIAKNSTYSWRNMQFSSYTYVTFKLERKSSWKNTRLFQLMSSQRAALEGKTSNNIYLTTTPLIANKTCLH